MNRYTDKFKYKYLLSNNEHILIRKNTGTTIFFYI